MRRPCTLTLCKGKHSPLVTEEVRSWKAGSEHGSGDILLAGLLLLFEADRFSCWKRSRAAMALALLMGGNPGLVCGCSNSCGLPAVAVGGGCSACSVPCCWRCRPRRTARFHAPTALTTLVKFLKLNKPLMFFVHILYGGGHKGGSVKNG